MTTLAPDLRMACGRVLGDPGDSRCEATARFRALLAGMLLLLASPLSAQQTAGEQVDELYQSIERVVAAAGLQPVIDIDHARLAAEAGVTMPPARVLLFSDPGLSARLLAQDIRLGLDLPFRMLAYDDGGRATVAYTDAEFLRRRYRLGDAPELSEMEAVLGDLLARLGAVPVSPVPVPDEAGVAEYGVIEIVSTLDMQETVERLRRMVDSQDDTVWFGEVDFTAQAAERGVEIAAARMLLFGGPAPGGVAMAEYPRIGLDAFCQKLYVYEDAAGAVRVRYNSIVALAELHYGSHAEPHRALDTRLTAAFRQALGQ